MKNAVISVFDRAFKLSRRGTGIGTELIAGLSTFAAMAYILAVNPAILSATGMDKAALVTVTALAAAAGCVLMALMTNLPIALAPAMGTNSYFALIICAGMGLRWQEALALVFYNGIFFLVISLTGLREKLVYGVPRPIQVGLQCGIGMFIAFFGFQSSKLIVRSDATLVTGGVRASPECLFALFGIAMMSVLMARKFKGAIVVSIAVLTVVAFAVTDSQGHRLAQPPDAVFSVPHGISATFLQLDWLYPFRDFNKALPVIFVLLMLDMLDTIATVIAMGRRTGLMDKNGRMKGLGRALTADASATIVGALLGTSTTGAYVESSAGIEAGGRTGLTSLVVAALFVLALFFSPLINAVPPEAAAPALVIIGVMMMQGMKDLNFDDPVELIPAIISMMMIALTFKISEGFAFGIISYVLLLLALRRAKEIGVTTWVLFALMCAFLAMS